MKVLPSLIIASAAALAALPAPALAEASRALAITASFQQRTPVADGNVVEISLVPSPPLEDGEVILVSVDDNIVVLPPGKTHISLSGVPSGTHVVDAVIVDGEANPVAAAQTVTFRVDAGLWI
jgi:hypothetical protein